MGDNTTNRHLFALENPNIDEDIIQAAWEDGLGFAGHFDNFSDFARFEAIDRPKEETADMHKFEQALKQDYTYVNAPTTGIYVFFYLD